MLYTGVLFIRHAGKRHWRGNHYNIKSSVRNTAAQAARAETNMLLPLRDVKSAAPMDPEKPVLYPGEPESIAREENLAHGIPVEESVWNRVSEMLRE